MDERQEKSNRELRAENRRLRRELHALKLELELLRGTGISGRDEIQVAFERQSQNEILFSKKRYFSYVFEMIRRTSVFRLYTKMLRGIRRFNLIRVTLGILAALFLALQSSALLVVSASVFVISIPFTFLITNATFILTFFHARKINRLNRERMMDKKVFVFFPPKKGALCKDTYFCGMVKDAAKDGAFSIIVSPYFWNNRGIDGQKRKPYLASRSEGDNLLIVRRHYYFTLKKHVFPTFSDQITELY